MGSSREFTERHRATIIPGIISNLILMMSGECDLYTTQPLCHLRGKEGSRDMRNGIYFFQEVDE